MDISQYYLIFVIKKSICSNPSFLQGYQAYLTCVRHPEMAMFPFHQAPHPHPRQGGALGPDSKRQRVTADAETARKELLGKFEPTDTFEARNRGWVELVFDHLWLRGFQGSLIKWDPFFWGGGNIKLDANLWEHFLGISFIPMRCVAW